MANHDYVINNGTGSAVRADINSALQAITTTNSGNSAPSTVAAGMLWWDSDGNTLYIRNTADNAWIPIAGGAVNIIGTTTSDFLVIQTNEDGAGSAPDVTLFRNSASPADSDHLGKIEWRGQNSAGEPTQYSYISGQVVDVTDGTEDGRLYLVTKQNGADTTSLMLDADGVAVAGNITLNTASAGIHLGVTTATAANLLDDYEEGTWTATLTGSTSNPSSSVTVTGQYTKVGNLVYVCAYFAGVNNTGASGGIRVTGLPFTPSPATQMSGAVSMHTIGTFGSGAANLSPYFQSSYVSFYSSPSGAGWSEATHNASGAVWLNFSGTYKV